MDKTTTTLSEEAQAASGAQSDNAPLSDIAAAPAGKLDADNYTAEDLDGVTEGLLGSGNLNYMMLQARQTDAMMAGGGFDNKTDNATGISAAMSAATIAATRGLADLNDASLGGGRHNAGDGSAVAVTDGGGQDYFNMSRFSGVSVTGGGDAGAGGFSSVSFSDATPPGRPSGGSDGFDGNGRDGQDGATGHDGVNGQDGTGGSGDTFIDIDIDNSIDLDLSDVTNLIDNTVTHVTDIISTVIDDTTSIVNNMVDNTTTLLQTIIDDATSIVNNTVNSVTDIDISNIINTILHPPGIPGGDPDVDLFEHNDLGLPQLDLNLDPIEAIIGNIDVGLGLTHDANGVALDLGAIVANIPLIPDLHIPVPLGGFAPVVDQILDGVPDLGNVLQDPVGAVTDIVDALPTGGLPLPGVPDLGAVIGDLLDGLAPSGGDTDIALTNNLGLPPLAVGLDAVESIVGDIDLGVDLAQGVNGLNIGLDVVALNTPVIDTVIPLALPDLEGALQDPVGAVEDILQSLAPAGNDTDIALTNNLCLPEVIVGLDPVESIVGDIDLGVDLAQGANGLNIGLDVVALNIPVIDTVITLGAPPAGSDTDIAVLNDVGLPQLGINLDAVENITGDIDFGVTLTHDAGGIDIGLDVIAASLPLAQAVVPVDLPPALVTDLLQNAPPAGGDNDLYVHNDLGLPHIDVNLDAIESVTGDIDIGLGLFHGAQGPVVEAGALAAGLNLAQAVIELVPDAPAGADTDLAVHNDLGLPQLDINLDPVESLVGDIDLGLNLAHTADSIVVDLGALAAHIPLADAGAALFTGTGAIDIVQSIMTQSASVTAAADSAITMLNPLTGGGALPALPSLPGLSGGDAGAWPQVADHGVSSAVADTIGSLIGNTAEAASVLSAPVGSISEGLGLLNVGGDHHGGGGLLTGLSHGHHGGIFG